MDTIFAPATARGRAGISVIRISGPNAHEAVLMLCGKLPPVRRASVRNLVWDGLHIDEAMVLVFEAGHSFTGEAAAELHLHGSLAVTTAALRALSRCAGLRMAEPGEFTRRALENGRLDLSQVEGLAALIEAETEAQRRQALRLLSGAVGKRAAVWRSQLIRSAALLEATIDFVDEDVPIDVFPEVNEILNVLLPDLRKEVQGSAIAERVRDGFEVAIVGAPNAGKSTLLNALAGRDAALTSEIAGTTRDVIEVRMDLAGIPVTLLDTAGLRATEDVVEGMGIDRAIARGNAADLRVFLTLDGEMPQGLELGPEDLVVYGKADLRQAPVGRLSVSGSTGQGTTELLSRIVAILEQRVAATATLTHVRHRNGADEAILALEAAKSEIQHGAHRTELAAENLRKAMRSLDRIVGRVDAETLLDEIFSSFCIGK